MDPKPFVPFFTTEDLNDLMPRLQRQRLPVHLTKDEKLKKIDVLNSIHSGHQGITKCQARDHVWWPGICKEIQDVKTCEICIKNQTLRHEPLIPMNFQNQHSKRLGCISLVISTHHPQPKESTSIVQAKAAVKTVKYFMKKNKYLVLALMEYWATPPGKCNFYLDGKVHHSFPSTSPLLHPEIMDQSKLGEEEEQRNLEQKMALYRSHTATDKSELLPGEKVWFGDL
ncbi:K02A2.6-like [Cordylochernes scorpioides]|uniref:K02A2.6-like n=1 Tax=Cordylochernes scorpioides TaxID=51811 RepID=A0ABY6LSH7_9ARAC|nr:K02A2.6-like [Cordylochernes scorpioides]